MDVTRCRLYLALPVGRDSDLCVDCAEIKEKYPLLELWSLMAEAAQEMGEADRG